MTLEGYVYPKVYIPPETPSWYLQNPGSFPNGEVRFSHDLVVFIDNNPLGIPLSQLDVYENGTNTVTPDGIFDMLILVYRDRNNLSMGIGLSGGAITSLGSTSTSGDSFGGTLTLGGLDVVDNFFEGSGVIAHAGRASAFGGSKKWATRMISHEIGHRQFGRYHTDGEDNMSTMNGSPFAPLMSAGDRMKLGWLNIADYDIGNISSGGGALNTTLVDSWTSAAAIRIDDGQGLCGDVVVEARTWSNFWDQPPDGINDDGDGADTYLPQEGLYVSKAGPEYSLCPSTGHRFRDMPNSGLANRTKAFFDLYKAGFVQGDSYNPFSLFQFSFSFNDVLDKELAITDVVPSGSSFSFVLRSNFLLAPGNKTLKTNFDFGSSTLARNSSAQWSLGGSFILDGSPANQIPAGTRFRLGDGAKIIINVPIVVSGTLANPIRFERLDPAKQWKWLDLKADGNVFEHVVFDGGNKTVEVASKNNLFKNSRFKNGWRGISSYWALSGGRSSFKLEQSIVESNSSVGIVAYHSDPEIVYSTIRSSGQAGLWLYDADGSGLRRSVIEGNAITSTTRSGVEVSYGGYLSTDYGPSPYGGYNRIAENGYHEVYVTSGAVGAFLGYGDGYADHNTIFDPNDTSSSEKYIYNALSSTVYARGNFWNNQGAPASELFGPVDAAYPILSDQTAGSGADEQSVPLSVEDPEPLVATTSAIRLSAGERNQYAGVQASAASSSSRTEWIGAEIRRLREAVADNPDAGEAPVWLRHLYALQTLDRFDLLGEKDATMALIRGITTSWEEDMAGGVPDERLHTIGETAALLEVRDAFVTEDYAQAGALLDKYDVAIADPYHRQELRLGRVSLYEYEGRFAEALAVLEEYEVYAALGSGDSGDYRIVRQALEERLAASDETFGQIAGKAIVEAETASAAFDLADPYPNPFKARTTIPFSLTDAAHLTIIVYDVLGRQVAMLARGIFDAGKHRVVLDGGGLASGTYLVRAHVSSGPGQPSVYARKLILLR